MPGILPVVTRDPTGECLVSHGYPPRIVDPKRALDLDVSDCTVFTVTHKAKTDLDFRVRRVADDLLEQALQAISEVTIWNKALERTGRVSSFLRQLGRLDAKYFLIEAPNDLLIGWRNPLFWTDREGAGIFAGILGNMIVTNGPAANPIAGVTRRVMSALDLINLGFYTESFVSLFSLVDDLTQEVIKAGMAKQGLDGEQQRSVLRAIKEDRLKHFLGTLAILCGWKSLAHENAVLYDSLLKSNTLRNSIMHGSARLFRRQAIDASNTLIETIEWLRSNPFNYFIPPLPLLPLAEGDFIVVNTHDHPENSGTTESAADA
jgi:hypothetical protein